MKKTILAVAWALTMALSLSAFAAEPAWDETGAASKSAHLLAGEGCLEPFRIRKLLIRRLNAETSFSISPLSKELLRNNLRILLFSVRQGRQIPVEWVGRPLER